MANTVTNTNNLSLCSILEKDKLTSSNFLDYRLCSNMRESEPLGEAPPGNATAVVRNAYRKHSNDLLDVGCLMLATMIPELQMSLMNTKIWLSLAPEVFAYSLFVNLGFDPARRNSCRLITGGLISSNQDGDQAMETSAQSLTCSAIGCERFREVLTKYTPKRGTVWSNKS
ncbi:hypothetical protein OSB04_020278 [Centaurea solstitialis]|uniref:Uncharacterized protein n=1 Tax=Centaurea solstitialis TaxID=347529 RepID=A0AA38T430_9ASTR|nr:hypothetical protein OSB04_020278 [Centaurea solstitialis]